MPITPLTGLTASLAFQATVNVQPPVGEVWALTSVNARSGVILQGYDPTSGSVIMLNTRYGTTFVGDGIGVPMPSNPPVLFTNSHYLQLWNNVDYTQRIAYSGWKLTEMSVSGGFRSVTLTTSSRTHDIRPPAGKAWILHNVSLDQDCVSGVNSAVNSTAGGATNYNAPFPKVIVTNLWYIRLRNNSTTNTRTCTYAYTEIDESLLTISGATVSVANGASVDIRPPVGQSWYVMAISMDGSDTFNVTATDGTNASGDSNNGGSGFWSRSTLRGPRVLVTNSLYLRITNTSGSARDIAYSYLVAPV